MSLPDYIDPQAWHDFVAMRKKKGSRAPWTEGAERLILRKLAEMHEQGFDATASLEQSVMHGWAGVFPVKGQQRQQAQPQQLSFRERELQAAADRAAEVFGKPRTSGASYEVIEGYANVRRITR